MNLTILVNYRVPCRCVTSLNFCIGLREHKEKTWSCIIRVLHKITILLQTDLNEQSYGQRVEVRPKNRFLRNTRCHKTFCASDSSIFVTCWRSLNCCLVWKNKFLTVMKADNERFYGMLNLFIYIIVCLHIKKIYCF